MDGTGQMTIRGNKRGEDRWQLEGASMDGR